MMPENGISLSRLVNHCMTIDGWERTFRVYVPDACKAGIDKAPLLITLHGGDYARAHLRTHWHELAEEKGFFVLYPETFQEGQIWNAWTPFAPADARPEDASYLHQVICYMVNHYPVDPGRIYLHGQAMGDMMGEYYAFLYPNDIAAAYLCSGPTKTKWWMTPDGCLRFRPRSPCPVIRLHGERDCFKAPGVSPFEAMLYKQQCHIDWNTRVWLEVNGCITPPEVYTGAEFSAVYYIGTSGCDFVDLFAKDGEHRPSPVTERLGWEYFLSGWQIQKGKHVQTAPEKTARPDFPSVAVAAGWNELLVRGERVHLEGKPALSRDGELFGSRILAEQLAGLLGRRLCPCTPWLKEDEELLPLGKALDVPEGATCFDVLYLTDHDLRLSFDLAYRLRVLLGAQIPLTSRAAWQLEDRIYQLQCAGLGFKAPKNCQEEIWQWSHTV